MDIKPTSPLATVWAARGGHGATTVAAVLGITWGAAIATRESWIADWILGTPANDSQTSAPYVADGGVFGPQAAGGSSNIVVLRGPCSIGLRSLAQPSDQIDGVIVICEPWRSITAQDVESVVRAPVVATIPHSPRIARLNDAGLLGARLPQLEEFRHLIEWASKS